MISPIHSPKGVNSDRCIGDSFKSERGVDDTYETIIAGLKVKYAGDEYMTNKLHKYLVNLPMVMDNIYLERQKNKMRIQLMTDMQQQFINQYLDQYPYYYCQTTNTFFNYINNKYNVCSDEDILHHVWKTMPHNEMIYDWQSSTRRYIVKRIRDKGLAGIVPESETIQRVLNELNSVFQNRDAAKYFLTILGDNIIKTKRMEMSSITVLVPIELKKVLTEMEKASQLYFGVNCTSSFKYRHFAHVYQNCRLLKILPVIDTNLSSSLLLDMLFVAIHYSERYEGSENFLNVHMNDTDLYRHVMYLINKTPNEIVVSFCDKYITKAEGCFIKWKDMQYLWGHFLNNNKLPAIIFMDEFRQLLMSYFNYNEHLDAFMGITSNYLPELERFLRYWVETVEQKVMSSEDSDEYEINELCELFTIWVESVNPNAKHREKHITEKKMCELINFYFPLLAVQEQRNICGIASSLWRKKHETLSIARGILQSRNTIIMENMSMSELYKNYCKVKKNSPEYNKIVVSKFYFEKIVLMYIYN